MASKDSIRSDTHCVQGRSSTRRAWNGYMNNATRPQRKRSARSRNRDYAISKKLQGSTALQRVFRNKARLQQHRQAQPFLPFPHPPAVFVRWLELGAHLAILAAVAVALLWPSPMQPDVLPGAFSMSDLLISHGPSALVIKEAVASGRGLPLWNPVFGGGRPLAADPLAALWYPATHLVHLFDLRTYFLLLLAGHLFLAGAGTLALGRTAFRLSPSAALVAGLSFMATPRMVAHLGAGHVTMVQTVAWLPWLALAGWAIVHAPGRWLVPFAGILALTLLAGHPQLAYYGCLMTAGVVLWQLGRRWQLMGRRGVLVTLAGLAGAGTLAAMLAAVHLLPIIEFTLHSTRQQSVKTQDALSVVSFLTALVGVRDTSSPVPHETLYDPGLGVLGLAVLGCAMRPRKGLPLLLGITLIAALSLGITSPVYQLAASILPGFNGFRGLGRIWFVGLLGIALLAGLGTETLLVALRRRRQPGPVFAKMSAICLLILSLVQANAGYTKIGDIKTEMQSRPIDRAAVEMAGSARIYGVQRNMHQIVATQLHARLADGWDPLLIQPYVAFMQRAGGYTFNGYQLSVPPFEVYDPGYPTSRNAQPKAALLGLVNVEVLLSRTRLRDFDLERVAFLNDTFLYRNKANAGPAYVVADTNNGQPPTINQIEHRPATVTVQEQQAERMTVRVTSPQAGWLVIGSPAFPGWHFQLNGQAVPASSIEGILPAIHIGAGTHDVTYVYQPWTVQTGIILAICGLLLAATWLIAAWMFRHGRFQRIPLEARASGS